MADANFGDAPYPDTNLLSILENFPRKQLKVLPHGVMVIKQCLSEEQQVIIFVSYLIRKARNTECLHENINPRRQRKFGSSTTLHK